MSEFLTETTEVKLYPGIISETIDRALGYQALISLEQLEQGGE